MRVRRIGMVIIPAIAVFIVASCWPPEPTVFAIYHGDPRPECASDPTAGRTDLVVPQTVDTEAWSDPIKLSAGINTACPEDDSEISPDGQVLYFYWSPDLGTNLTNEDLLTGTTGVYRARRTGGPGDFGQATFYELRRGTGGAVDGHPRLTPDGELVYFHSTRADNTGYRQTPAADDPMDIYVARIHDGVPEPATNLGTVINSPFRDGEMGISPDGQILYFASDRQGGVGGVDLFFSLKLDGEFTEPVNMGNLVNTPADEGQPAFAANDPDTMFFVSNRDGIGVAIYRSRLADSVWGAPELVVRGQVGSPSLTEDGQLMYFVHILTDTDPDDPVFGADLYYASAVP